MKNLIYTAIFASPHLMTTNGHFHGCQFSIANYFFIWPVLSYLAVAMATWQHWLLQIVALKRTTYQASVSIILNLLPSSR